jgi:hypothetical protein
MDRSLDPDTSAQGALAREMSLVDSAIAMVALGKASRVQLGGLAYGDALLDYARRAARRRGVRVTPIWGLGEERLALTFESPAGPRMALLATDGATSRAGR